MMNWDKYGLVVRKGRIPWARCGIVPWIPNHQAAKLCITKVAESLEEGILGYGNQNRFHRFELWCACAELQCCHSWRNTVAKHAVSLFTAVEQQYEGLAFGQEKEI